MTVAGIESQEMLAQALPVGVPSFAAKKTLWVPM